MQLRFLFIRTCYPEFLSEFYAREPDIERLDYRAQLQRLFDTGFGVGDAYSDGLRRLECEAEEVICNADRLQERWVSEQGLSLPHDRDGVVNAHDRRRQIVAAQIKSFRPDVLFVFEWCPLGDAFLAAVKSDVRLVVGQVASPLRADRSYAAYDLMLSSVPPLVDHFRSMGVAAKAFRLGFDERVLERLGDAASEYLAGGPGQAPGYDVTFVGGLAPSHPDRTEWLEALARQVRVDIFGYGWERVAADSPLRERVHGPVWGWGMYETLRRSRVTLNRHAHIEAGHSSNRDFANNMRLFEATGVGTCLVTEARSNLAELFEPEREVITYRDTEECVDKVRYLLANESERRAVALAGQRRTLVEHTYRHRMAELLDLVRRRCP
jgi:spore maturation protein CgeB